MGKCESFIEQYRYVNVLREETGSISVARRLPDGDIDDGLTTDIAAVWLNFDESTYTDTYLRVSLQRKSKGRKQSEWLVNPFDSTVETVERVDTDNFEIVRDEALFGISAVKAYLQLSQHKQDRIGNIVEDKTTQLSAYVDIPPEVEVMQRVAKSLHDPSPNEQLVLFDYTLRSTRS